MAESTLTDSSAFARHAYDLRQGDVYRDTRVLTVARDLIQAHQQQLSRTQFEWSVSSYNALYLNFIPHSH